MKAYCVTVRDPFHPASSREVRQVGRRRRIRALAPRTQNPHIALLNGTPILRAGWNRRLRDGDTLAFVVLPQGGNGGSNPLQMILMLAVMTFAPEMGMMAYQEATLAMGGTITSIGSTIAVAAATFAGMALVNVLVPPPKLPSDQQAAAMAAPSPTYNTQAQGNLARLDAAIPVQYGRLCAYPDFAAQPYAEYAGNEQYLYQLLCLGMGEYAIEAIRIDDTPISSWAEIDYEVIAPGGTITKFPANVTTSSEVSGQELLTAIAGTYNQVGTTITVTATAHAQVPGRPVYLDFTSGTATDDTYTVVTAPTLDTFTVTAGSATTSGNVNVQRYLGPFIANSSGTLANTLGIDFVLPRGLYSFDTGSGNLNQKTLNYAIEVQQIDDAGTPIGGWNITTGSYTDSTTTPQRYSQRLATATGRFQVRARRTDIKDTATTVGHDLSWGGLRAYLPETRNFGNVTLIAMRMRASNNLSLQASRKINVICTRKLPIWNGSSWSANTATRSIAWSIADICLNTYYGAALTDSRIDLAGLLALDATWTARGDEFNGRFDNAMTIWEGLTKIAQAGRAKPYMQGGVVRVARDQAASVPVALFSMRNILRGSFSVDYLMPTAATADAIDVTYFDSVNWASRTVRSALSGSTSSNPVKVDLFGVTSRDQAYREGLYQAASNRYRRKVIKFGAEMEGFIPSFGDLIAVAHDMPQWGQTAEVTAWDSGTLTLTLSEPMTWGTGTHYVGLRKRDGSVDGPYVVTAGATAYQVVLSTTPAITPYTGGSEERTQVAFGWGETWRQQARVVSITPRDLYHVDIQAINEDPSVHTADTGVTTPPIQSSQLTTLYTAPTVAGLMLRSSASDNSKALLTWQSAPGADHYLIEMANSGDPTMAWTRVGETSASNFAVTAIYGSQTWIRVCAIGLTKGPWVTMLYGSSADYMWLADANPMWNAVTTTLMWRY